MEPPVTESMTRPRETAVQSFSEVAGSSEVDKVAATAQPHKAVAATASLV